jgi:hypothetical protein
MQLRIWNNEESLSNNLISNPWAKPNTSTTYTAIITDAAGCIASSTCYVGILASIPRKNSVNNKLTLYLNP